MPKDGKIKLQAISQGKKYISAIHVLVLHWQLWYAFKAGQIKINVDIINLIPWEKNKMK